MQVGRHYYFAVSALGFDSAAAHGMRRDITCGSAMRFEPGQRREVRLILMAGARRIYGFSQAVMGNLDVP